MKPTKLTAVTTLTSLAVLAALGTLARPVAAQETSAAGQATPARTAPVPDDWSFAIAPYLWLASVSAETSVPQTGAGRSSSVQQFDTRISGGFMIAAEARYRSFGLLVEFNWLRLDTESSNPGPLYSGVNLTTDYIYSTAALTYDLPLKGNFHAQLQAGVRIWNVSSDFELETGSGLPSVDSSRSETWVTPLAGANLRYDLPHNWLLLVRGTVGGFSSDSIQWDVFGGVGYEFNKWCQVTLGYRYLHEDYKSGSFTFNAQAQGALFGAVFRF